MPTWTTWRCRHPERQVNSYTEEEVEALIVLGIDYLLEYEGDN